MWLHICGYAKSFTGARGAEIEEVMLQLVG
jgi:hypothetical protein